MMQPGVSVRISPSRIEGLGLFAAAPIAAGTLLWRYTEPIDYRIGRTCRLSPQWQAHFERYTYQPKGAEYLIVCGDAGMFWNHSDTPNCIERDNETYAARDIAAGEELVVDYHTFESRPMPWLTPKE